MDINTALAFSGLGVAAVATSVLGFRRLQLSRAKHRSLAGHSRMARRMARFVPFYEYDETRFFCSDGAGPDVATQRRDGFMRLAATFASKFPETTRQTADIARRVSDL